MAVGDVWKLVIHFTQFSQQIRPGLHFQSNVALATGQDLIDAWKSVAQTAMLAPMAADVSLTGYEAQDKVPGTAATIVENLVTPLPGAQVGAGLPPANGLVFSLKSALKSRRSRGRVYWPGLTEEATASGALIPGFVGGWDSFRAAIAANFVGASPVSGWRLVVYSPEDLTPPKAPPVFKPRPGTVITAVSTLTLDTVVRSQRRRQIGLGQ